MPRRKRDYLSDDLDSDDSLSGGSEDDYNSQEDPDSRAERELFEHNDRKRKRNTGGKASAWEGIFGEDEEEERAGGRGLGSRRGGRGGKSGRTDWTKAPTFVTKASDDVSKLSKFEADEEPTKASVVDPDDDEDEDDGTSEEDDEEEQSDSGKRSPIVREADYDDDDPPRRGMGLGFNNGFTPSTGAVTTPEETENKAASNGRAGIGSSSRGRGGIGSAGRPSGGFPPPASISHTPKGGLGSSDAPPQPIEEHDAPAPNIPTAFGRPPPSLTSSSGSAPVRRNFTGRATPASTSARPQVDLPASEMAALRKVESSFGARMLAKHGWEAGKGLGVAEDGRAVPIQVGKVLRGQGLQSGVRSEDSKREARRRGEVFSDDEDDKPKRKGKKGGLGGPSEPRPLDQSWKKQKKVKVKVEHKTYEQLLAEAGESAAAGVGLVLDARGGELKEVSSLAGLSLSSWTPTSDTTKLPELRHNLRLIVDVTKADVEALAREGKTVNEKRRWALREEELAKQRIRDSEKSVSRLRQIQSIVSKISQISIEQSAKHEPSLHSFAESFDSLLHDFKEEYLKYSLDDVIVGAIGQVLRRAFADWQPFDVSSDILLSSLKQWRQAYNLSHTDPDLSVTVNGSGMRDVKKPDVERVMTAWESLLWTLWVPKVRSAINNEWDAASPNVAVHLLESWDPILPAFIRDNILDQLVLPKVKKAVESWDSRPSRSGKAPKSLAGIVFPWLPLLGERVEEVLGEAKRRIRSVMRNWVVKDGVPSELIRWKKDIYTSSEWDKLVLANVLPKLGASLRDDFSVNPRNQDMAPLVDWVMPWHLLLRGSMFSHLLEVEFFPKWLDILYIWLIQPAYKPDEVANWFIYWKDQFPEEVREMRGIAHGFNRGLDLMNEAIQLGSQAPSRLKKPNYVPLAPSKSTSSSKSSSTKPTKSVRPLPPVETEITFKQVAEDYVAQYDLVFLPLGRSHDVSGRPLFKVSKGVDGRGGVNVYVGDDAIFALGDEGNYRAVSLEDLVKRAKG